MYNFWKKQYKKYLFKFYVYFLPWKNYFVILINEYRFDISKQNGGFCSKEK